MTAGAAAGNIIAAIIAAIIAIHTAMKTPNDPGLVAIPMSIPFICQTATAQHAAADPTVTVSANIAAAVLAPVVAAGRETGPAPAGSPARRRQDPSP